MPKFQKDLPKNWAHYFNPASDEAFKRKHPVGYVFLVICGIVALILPLVFLILVTELWYPAPGSGFLLLAILGCLIVGIGLFNIVAAWIGQYLGHWLTIGSFLLGGALIAVSLGIIYTPSVYSLLDESMVTYYFVTLLFLLVPLLYYVLFRGGVNSWLERKRLSKKKLKALKKGKKNFWWYEALHKEVNMGVVYHANKFVTVLYPILFALTATLGWLRFMTPVITGLYALLSLAFAGMLVFASIQESISNYGTVFAFVRRSENGGFDFPLLGVAFSFVAPLLISYAHVLITLDVFNIPR